MRDRDTVTRAEHPAVIAFSGVGLMGGAIAERLRLQGHDLRVYDAAEAVRDRLRAGGFDVAASLADACSGCDVVFLCLPDAAAVAASTREILSASPAPGLCIDLTSSAPSTTREVALQLAAGGIELVDAPVSGGVVGARAGRLTAIVGGTTETVERATPWLQPFASNIMWAGPVGSGHAAKAINNALSAASLTVTAEILVAGLTNGMSPWHLIAALNASDGRSQNSEVKFPDQILPRVFGAGFTSGLMLKDIGTVCAMADEVDAPIPMVRLLRERWSAFNGQFGRTADFTRIEEAIEQWSGSRAWSPADRETSSRVDSHSDGVTPSLAAATAAACAVAACEMLNLALRREMDVPRLLAILNESSGRSQATRDLYPGIVLPRLETGSRLRDAEAALTTAVDVGQRGGVSVATLVAAQQVLRIARAGGNDPGFTHLARVYSQWSGAEDAN